MRWFALCLLISLPAIAHADGDTLTIDKAQSSLTYHLVHKMHKVDGVSRSVEGKALLVGGGKAQVLVRVPVESFDSDNVNRDAHMKEAVEAAKFPTVELKALGEGITPPASFPTTEKKTFKAQLTLHGIKGLFDVPVELTWESATKVRCKASFTISLDAYKIERPSLMFVKVDDPMVLDAKILFSK